MNEKEHRYRNRFEERTGRYLSDRGVEFDYESERIPYTVSGTYLPDFVIRNRMGKTIYIETKGNGRSFDGPARRKLRAVKEQNPELDIRIVFYSDGKCGPKRKDGTFMRQSDWAKKYGLPYAIKEIPSSWYAE